MRKRGVEFTVMVVVLLLAFAIPAILPGSSLFFFTELLTAILYGIAVNMLIGFTGIVSFGQAGYYGLGGYAAAMLIRATTPDLLLPALLFGAVVAGIGAFILGAIALRATGVAFAMLTLAFAQMLFLFALTQTHITGGENGIPGLIRSSGAFGPIPLNLGNPHVFYYFTLLVVAAGVVFLRLVVASPFGYALRVVREDPKRAEFLGIRVKRYQLASFVIAGFFSGLAGALFVFLVGLASPEMVFWSRSGDPIIMALLGGVHFFWGPAVGAVIYLSLIKQISELTAGWMAYVGILLLFLVLVLPEGLLGLPNRLRLLRHRRQAGRAMPAAPPVASTSIEGEVVKS